MPTTRRAQERAERHRLIVDTARVIAEEDGWEAVTTRRLAEAVGYSQPVLYGHFANREAIVAAVAVEGFAELADALEKAARSAGAGSAGAGSATARSAGGVGAGGVGAGSARGVGAGGGGVGLGVVGRVAVAYLGFARGRPALYDAMFAMPMSASFAAADTPEEFHAAFRPVRGAVATEAQAEVLWAALHGLALLDRAGRLRAGREDERIQALIQLMTSAGG